MSTPKRFCSVASTSAPDEDICRLFPPNLAIEVPPVYEEMLANEDIPDLRLLPPHIPPELAFEILKRCDVSALKTLVRMDETFWLVWEVLRLYPMTMTNAKRDPTNDSVSMDSIRDFGKDLIYFKLFLMIFSLQSGSSATSEVTAKVL